MPRVRYLIGIGNETMTDDGVGPRVAEAVSGQARELGFETLLIGHDAVGILAYFDEATEHILFVDCVRMGKAPGEWACFTPEDVKSRKTLDRLTTHEGDILRIVELARQLGCPIPAITIVGIEPDRIEPGLALSPALQARLAEYATAAVDQMRRAGDLP
jgi:hydrogenase maturation protease